MTGLLDIEGHLVFYRSYHFNKTNVRIHLMCIPIILLSAAMLVTPFTLWGSGYPHLNLASVLAWSYGTYYVLLDWPLGIPSFAFLAAFAYWSRWLYQGLSPAGQGRFVTGALAAHVTAWLLQFYGHAAHEKRAPALLDNLLQAIVLAPFFVVYEIAFACGFRKSVKTAMDVNALKLVREYKARRHQSIDPTEPKLTRR